MKYIIKDDKYKFFSVFDTKTGEYIRSGIIKNGKDTDIDPFMASYPHLIDVGVMGHCTHGKTGLCAKAGIGCYQSGMFIEEPNMTVENFRNIAKQSKHRCNQFALGGRGDPDQHEHFEELLKICRENDIIPNFTTSGYGITPELARICKEYCGAVAVSWYRNQYTLNAINILLLNGVKTNIHYVLGNNTIDEAIERLERDDFPQGINAVIFLLHKPAGQGAKMRDNILKEDDPKVKTFFELLDRQHLFKVGMDSCCVPGAINFCKNVDSNSLDTCEGGRYSCYIGPDMIMVPCSFDQKRIYGVQLNKNTNISDAWNSPEFNKFRNIMQNACPHCEKRLNCLGGCPLMPEIVLCENQDAKTIVSKL